MEEQQSSTTDVGDYKEEIKNGIFHLTISLCQHLSTFVGLNEAKIETAEWLEEIASGLRSVKANPLESS